MESKEGMKLSVSTLVLLVLCFFPPGLMQAETLESVAPVVVKTTPEAGSQGVAPGTAEIRVTFSKPMRPDSYSWVIAWQGAVPEMVGKPHFASDHKTCVLQVKLEPGKTYGYWINSAKFQNFKDEKGNSAVPYLLVFQTKDK